MKNIFHVCFTSHKEVPFRSDRDMDMFFNYMSIAAFKSETDIIVDATMSTHQHCAIFCEDPFKWVRNVKAAYSQFFNRKYSRSGQLGDKGFFFLLLEGFIHVEIALAYILRNILHHGQATTAFGTQHSTIHSLFAKDMGWPKDAGLITDKNVMRSCFNRRTEIPDNYVMNSAGIFVRESVEQIQQAEAYFVSPKNFLLDMNRATKEEWLSRQDRDDVKAERITIGSIEPNVSEREAAALLANESGRNARRGLGDMAVCDLIDNIYLPHFRKSSVYQLSEDQKDLIAKELIHDHKVRYAQINRCLYFYDKLQNAVPFRY